MERRKFIKGFVAGMLAIAVMPRLVGEIAPDGASSEEKGRIIAEMLKSHQGRMDFARSMAQPIKRRLDYQSIGRKAFVVQELPSGVLPIYDKDPDVKSEPRGVFSRLFE